MMDEQELIEEAWRQARYAHDSYRRELVYEAHGFVRGMLASGALKWEDVLEIETFICRDTLNDRAWIQKEYARERSIWAHTIRRI